ncbi:hypothetical protein ACSSS7_007048 [Eimeria intestinalis]
MLLLLRRPPSSSTSSSSSNRRKNSRVWQQQQRQHQLVLLLRQLQILSHLMSLDFPPPFSSWNAVPPEALFSGVSGSCCGLTATVKERT